jgi:tetratricopeptide (TPR) repeat protein
MAALASSISSSSLLSAEQKNAAIMNTERTFLTRTFQAALDGDFDTLRTQVESYQQQQQDQDQDQDATMVYSLSHVDIVSQFRDGNKRTALHFACQSSSRSTPTTIPDKKDIVQQILDWLLLLSSQQQPSTDSSCGSGSGSSSSSSNIPALLRMKDKEGLTPLMLAARFAADDPATAERRVLAIVLADAKSQQQIILSATTTATATATTIASWPKLGLQRSKVAGATALHYAAGCANATATTIQAITNVSGMAALMAFSKRGGTPLHWAACATASAASAASATKNDSASSSTTTIGALVNAMANAAITTTTTTTTTPTTEKANEDDSANDDDDSTRRRIALGNFIHASQLPSSSSDVDSDRILIPPAMHMACAALHQEHAMFLLQTCVDQHIALAPTLTFLLPPFQNSIVQMAADLNLLRFLDVLCNNEAVQLALQQEPAPPSASTLTATASSPTALSQSLSLWDWLRDYQNNQGLTALQMAAREGHVGCVWILMGAGSQQKHTEEDARRYTETFQKEHQEQQQDQQSSSNSAVIAKEQNDESSPSPVTGGSSSSVSQEEEQAAKAEAARLLLQSAPTTSCPEKAQAFKLQGNAHFAAQAWQEAIDFYSLAVQEDPTNAALYSNRSAAYHHLDMAAAATSSSSPKTMTDTSKQDNEDTANEKGTTDKEVAVGRTTTVAQQKALSDAWLCRALRPDWPKASFRLATALSAVGRFEDAAVAAWEGLQQDSENDELKKLLQDNVKMGREQHLLQYNKTQKSDRTTDVDDDDVKDKDQQ